MSETPPVVQEAKSEVKVAPVKEAPKKTAVAPKKVTPVKKKPAAKAKPKVKAPTKAPPKKAAHKKEEPVKLKNVKGAQLPRSSKPGPAMVKLANKFKKAPVMGECDVKGCPKKAVSPRGWRCLGHKKDIRKLQLKANNSVWRKRVKNGEAGHHVVYDGRATEFTLQNRDVAKKIVAAGRSILLTQKDLDKAIQHTPADARKAAKARA